MLAGEIAALGTAVCWSLGPILFTLAGRHIGAINVNRFRLLLAFIFFFLTHLVLFRQPVPTGLPWQAWAWLLGSGILGMAIGDSFMYKAFLLFGPRRTMLITAIVPVISTTAAWLFLFETPTLLQLLGIALTVSGVGWVVLARGEKKEIGQRARVLGGLLAVGAAFSQAAGLILAKHGMNTYDISPLPTSLIRIIGAFTVFWLWTAANGQLVSSFRSLSRTRTRVYLLLGSLIGPYAGIGLSMVAIHWAPVGVASAIMAINPVLIIPAAYYVLKDSAGWRGVGGALVAVTGVILLLVT